MNISSNGTTAVDVLFSATNVISLPVCALAAILVLRFKLYRKPVYRLALYQVLASLVIAVIQLLEIIFVKYQKNPWPWPDANACRLCVAMAWLQLYSFWLKIMFTVWVTFHLFCFAVYHKNMKKLEVLYIITSLTVPQLVSAVPLVTHTYGFSPVDGCYIPVYEQNYTFKLKVSIAEKFALLNVPAIIILLLSSVTMIVMVVKLCWRSRYEPIASGNQFCQALKQVIPLAAFPILFFIFIIPVVVFDIYYSFLTPVPNKGLVFTLYISITFWSLSSGVTLLVHICMARLPTYFKKRKKKKERSSQFGTFGPTVEESVTHDNSATSFSLPTVSLATM